MAKKIVVQGNIPCQSLPLATFLCVMTCAMLRLSIRRQVTSRLLKSPAQVAGSTRLFICCAMEFGWQEFGWQQNRRRTEQRARHAVCTAMGLRRDQILRSVVPIRPGVANGSPFRRRLVVHECARERAGERIEGRRDERLDKAQPKC